MKRAKITLLLYFVLVVALIILSIQLKDKNSIVLLILMVLIMGGFTINRIEAGKIAMQVSESFENKEYDQVIEHLKKSSEESIVYMNCVSSLVTLAMVYMLNNNIKEVKELIKKYKVVRNNKNICYINMILAIDDNNLEEAKKYFEILNNYKNSKFAPQKEVASLILKMIEKNKYNPDIERKTQYQLVKDICQRYKNKEEKTL